MPSPVAPFTRQDAIYFLFLSGHLIAEHSGLEPRATGRTVTEALATIGVSNQELRQAVNMVLERTPSRWEQIPADTEVKEH